METLLATDRVTKLINVEAAQIAAGEGVSVGKDLKVWLVDELGNEYPAEVVSVSSINKPVRGAPLNLSGGARFTVGSLRAGRYTIHARLRGYDEASRVANLPAGTTLTVKLTLAPTQKAVIIKEPPPKRVPADWIKPGWYAAAVPIDTYVNGPWPPENIDPLFDPTYPPYDVAQGLGAWADRVQAQYPDLPVDRDNIQVFVDRNHTPDVTATTPYAYLVFGDSGAYMPMVLTPSDKTLDKSVGLTKAGLSGVDQSVSQALGAVGIGDVDVLAASWSGLVQNALGIGSQAAASLIGDGRKAVSGLQNSLEILGGVDSALAGRLGRLGINNKVDLANASPQQLHDSLGDSVMTLAFAERLVDEARALQPTDTWSLSSTQLALKTDQIAALGDKGIHTQGQLKARAADAATKADIATTLGKTPEQLDVMVGSIDLAASNIHLNNARKANDSVTTLDQVGSSTAIELGKSNVGTLSALAHASLDQVVGAFSGNREQANAAIGAAQAALGMGH